MGKVFLPTAPMPWKADLLGQLTRFPAGRFDDSVDVCSLIGRGLEHVRSPKIARALERRQADTPAGPNEWMAG
jgi:phage terminase large subunit-like protein